MAKIVTYRQCRLVKPTKAGELHQMSWIPSKFAVLNNTIRLKTDAGWDDGWHITFVGPYEKEEAAVRDFSQQYKRQRRASDI